jgi:hypothetical protein
MRVVGAVLIASLLVAAAPALAQDAVPAQDAAAGRGDAAEADNGTDPTRVRRSLTVDFEHLDLRGGFSSNTLEVDFNQPLAARTGCRRSPRSR